MYRIFIPALIGSLVATPAVATQTRVVDGDTIIVGDVTYRLHGIDAPEAGQKCRSKTDKQWNCGKAAIETMQALVAGGAVRCEGRGQDRYDRTLAVCYSGQLDINAEMVRQGLAWSFRQYADTYNAIEDEARARKAGIWQTDTLPPWEYRKVLWSKGVSGAPENCPIKGNISKSGRIYHAPWSPWYSRTKISISKGERWFCSEAEALAAGWRAPIWGK